MTADPRIWPIDANRKILEMRKNNVSRQRIASHLGISSHSVRTIEKNGVSGLSLKYKKKVLQWLKSSGRVLHGPEKVRGRKPNTANNYPVGSPVFTGMTYSSIPSPSVLELNGQSHTLKPGSSYRMIGETLYELVKV